MSGTVSLIHKRIRRWNVCRACHVMWAVVRVMLCECHAGCVSVVWCVSVRMETTESQLHHSTWYVQSEGQRKPRLARVRLPEREPQTDLLIQHVVTIVETCVQLCKNKLSGSALAETKR